LLIGSLKSWQARSSLVWVDDEGGQASPVRDCKPACQATTQKFLAELGNSPCRVGARDRGAGNSQARNAHRLCAGLRRTFRIQGLSDDVDRAIAASRPHPDHSALLAAEIVRLRRLAYDDRMSASGAMGARRRRWGHGLPMLAILPSEAANVFRRLRSELLRDRAF
jgi:hypothetical protein